MLTETLRLPASAMPAWRTKPECCATWLGPAARRPERARSRTAEEAAAVARRRGAGIALTYAEWLLNGPSSPLFKQLCEETGRTCWRGWRARTAAARPLGPIPAVAEAPSRSLGRRRRIQ